MPQDIIQRNLARYFRRLREPFEVENLDTGRSMVTHRSAAEAYRCAKTFAEFDAIASKDLVKIEIKDDDLPYDVSYVDTWTNWSREKREAEKKRLRALANEHGTVGIVGYYRDPDTMEWVEADSCWGYLGNDVGRFENPCGRADIEHQTLEAFAAALAAMAIEIEDSVMTLAGVH